MDVQFKAPVASVESGFPRKHECLPAPQRRTARSLLWTGNPRSNFAIPALAHHPDWTTIRFRIPPSSKKCGCEVQCHYRLLPRGIFLRQRYARGLLRRTALTGSGQNIGLLEYAGFDIADVNTYYANAKQTRTAAVTGISTDGSPITCHRETRL